ncbi:TetR/AcrR family transcriptional regulator [Pseudonocardia sp. CA-107938]|uniref:TetR/AcrR family transcriptional regulator n=1 Tax=Pseudonocardia sp. CA-107938 TaxID=3240021 RepID=UPI003D939C51
MARPRTFDEERALDAAMRAFWATGFTGTSTDDLCAATGLGRSSIYNTFTGKRELFLAALRRYSDEMYGRASEIFGRPSPIRDRVRALFEQAIEPLPGDPVGCLVVNSVVELGGSDPEVAELLHRDGERRLVLMRDALAAAQTAGEIAPGRDPEALARFVGATISGMRVAARAGTDRAALAAIADTAIAAL